MVNRLFNIWREDLKQQTQRGKIQFQSEGAEVFYRNIEMRPLSFKQSFPKLVPDQQKLSLIPGQSQQVDIVNNGEAVEIIAAELIGRNIESVIVKLPKLPLVLKKGDQLKLPVSLKPNTAAGNKILFRLETVLDLSRNLRFCLKQTNNIILCLRGLVIFIKTK